MRRGISVLTAAVMSFVATNAFAESSDPDATKEVTKPHDDLLLTAGAGAFGETHGTGGAIGLTVLRQKGWLGYGGTFEYGGTVFDYTTVTGAPMLGLFVPGPRGLRVGLAGVAGIHTYDGVGRGFISSSDPGASGTTAFVGTRLILGAELGGKTRFHIGIQLSADDDLTRLHKTYTFEQNAFTSPHSETATHTVGALRFGAMLALGAAFDL